MPRATTSAWFSPLTPDLSMNEMNPKKDKYIAAGITFAVALILLLFLFFCGMDFDRSMLAETSMPEIQALVEDEELFIEPEIVENLGEQEAVKNDEPAPMIKGNRKSSDREHQTRSAGKNPKPAPAEPKKVTQKKESPVKATEPSKTDEEKKKVTSKLAGKFSPHNGAESGKSGSSGAGATVSA